VTASRLRASKKQTHAGPSLLSDETKANHHLPLEPLPCSHETKERLSEEEVMYGSEGVKRSRQPVVSVLLFPYYPFPRPPLLVSEIPV